MINISSIKFKKIDILTSVVSIIIFFKFFIFYEQIPLHDEVTAIERFTEWKNFLRKDGVNNHTLISFYGTIIRTFFGFDLSLFRLISFLSFIGILFLFNRFFNNLFYCFLFLIIICNSNFLFNALNTFRGYYIYSLLSCIIFYQLYLLQNNKLSKNNIKFIFVILSLMVVNALYGLYVCAPVLLAMFTKMFREKVFYYNGIVYFLIPVSLVYLIFFFLDGLVINNNNNLNLSFIFNNLNLIFIENIKTGFINVFNATPDLIKNNEFKSWIYAFQRFYYGEDNIYSKEYIFIIIYILSIIFLILNLLKSPLLIDYVILFFFLFFFFIDKNPFIRVHSGSVYFCIFYIFYNFKNLDYKKLFVTKKINPLIFFISTIILILYYNPDSKWQETKLSIIKIEKTLSNTNCVKANNILNQYEIWIVKNIFPNLCSSRYDFKKKINLLF